MEYFGEPWPSGVCDDGQRVLTPVGERCFFCDEPIQLDHQGTFTHLIEADGIRRRAPIHRECSLREVVGGIGHLEDHDYWCTQQHDPDGGRTRRQSSLETWDWVRRHGSYDPI